MSRLIMCKMFIYVTYTALKKLWIFGIILLYNFYRWPWFDLLDRNFWIHMSNCSMFQYLLHNTLLSNKVIYHKNHSVKCLIHESATKCSGSMTILNSPLHHAVHILTSWDQDDAQQSIYSTRSWLWAGCSQREVDTEPGQSQCHQQDATGIQRDWKSHRKTQKWMSFGHIPWWWLLRHKQSPAHIFCHCILLFAFVLRNCLR